jgi:hypothetical protein
MGMPSAGTILKISIYVFITSLYALTWERRSQRPAHMVTFSHASSATRSNPQEAQGNMCSTYSISNHGKFSNFKREEIFSNFRDCAVYLFKAANFATFE